MAEKPFTKVPNVIFDHILKELKGAELKILLIILRQTRGWVLRNGQRKQRDRISRGYFMTKTGLSNKSISDSIDLLLKKKLIRVTDYNRYILHSPTKRQGKSHIYYSLNDELL